MVIKEVVGVGLIVLALTPTPDDVTIISPVAQLGIGLKLLGVDIPEIVGLK